MKLIMENWRKFINEAAQGFGPGGLSELGDMSFRIEEPFTGYYEIYALDGSGNVMGYIELDNEYVSKCGIFMTHSQIADQEKSSLGPFLYDLAIELGSLVGSGVTSSSSPSGIGDTDSLKSKSYAINVWVYYLKKRSDIEKHPLNCLPMIKNRHTTIVINNAAYTVFPDHELKHIHKGFSGSSAAKNPPSDIQDKINAINHFYRKDPIFLDQLKAMGKLEDTTNVLSEGKRHVRR